MLPSQHHASFSIALKRFMISLYARLMSFLHKINPLDYAMNHYYLLSPPYVPSGVQSEHFLDSR